MSAKFRTMVGMTSRILDALAALEPQDRSTPLRGSLLLGFDTETTGLMAGHDAIVSASLVLRDPAAGFSGDMCDAWLINPHRPISPGASAVNGFTDEFVAEHGEEPAPALDCIAEVIATTQRLRIPLVAYNAPFDVNMLNGDLERWDLEPLARRTAAAQPHAGADSPDSPATDPLVIDPLVIDREVSHRPGSRALAHTTEYYGVYPHGSFHDAATDTVAALDLLGPMATLYPQVGALTLEELMPWQREAFDAWRRSYNSWAKQHGRRPRNDTWFPRAS